MKSKSTLRHFLAIAGSSMMALSSVQAVTYYWDNNGTDAGFGTAGGDWDETNGSTLLNTDNTGGGAGVPVVGTAIVTTTADQVDFGRTGTGNMLATGTITVSGTVNVGTMGSGNPTTANQTYTFSGGIINLASAATFNMNNYTIFSIDSQITGASTSLTKLGTGGTLRLNNANNSYTGRTIMAGTIQAAFLTDGDLNSSIGASSSDASNIVLSTGNREGTLSYVGATNATTNRLMTLDNSGATGGNGIGNIDSSGTGTINFTNTGALAIIGTSTRIFRLGGTNTGNNIFNPLLENGTSTALSVNKRGAGTWILANNANSYTGATTLEAGSLVISKIADYGVDCPIGKGTAGNAIAFAGGGLVYTGAGDSTNRVIQASAGIGSITNNGSGALNFTATGNFNVAGTTTTARSLFIGGTNGGTISGAIQNNNTGLITVSKFGIGTWTLAAQNSYTGTTDLQGGTLQLQSGASNITQTLGVLQNRFSEATLLSNKAGTGSLSTTFNAYTRLAGGTGNIVSTGGTNGTDNSVNITGADGFINAGLFFGGSEFAARHATDGYVRALAYGSDASAAAVDTITASNHVKLTASPGSNQDTISLSSLNLQGAGVNWTSNSGQTLTVPGILKSGGGSSTISGGSVDAGTTHAELIIRTDTASDDLVISSNINGGTTGTAANSALTKSGAGTLTLTGTNDYQGQTHVNAGTLSISSNANLGRQSTAAALNLKGGTLQVTADVGLFNGTAGTNNRAVTLINQSNIEVTGTNTLTIAGVVSNNAGAGGATPGFNKTGTGTLTLSGVNTYNGATVVNAGTLKLGANDVLPNTGTSTVTLGSATLDADTFTDTAGTLNVTGSAVINLGTGAKLTFANSSTVEAGTWAGTLNLVGFVSGSSLNFSAPNGLTAAQLSKISATGFTNFSLDAEGDLIADSTSGPGPLDKFVISAIGSPQTVGTSINGITITAKDAANQTVTSFTGNVTFGGTGGFSGTSATFTAGVLSGVSVIPANAGSNLTFVVTDPVSGKTGSTTIATIQSQYQAWASGGAFDADANGDGVKNGLAFLLGASGPGVNALNKLPTVSQNTGALVMTFQMLPASARGTAALSLEHSTSLNSGAWTSVTVPESNSTVDDVIFTITGTNPLNVTATIPAIKAGSGKLFGRLKAVNP